MNTEKTNVFQRIDFNLIFILFLLAVISLVAIYSSSPGHFYTQLTWYIIGFVIMMLSLLIDYRRLMDLSWPLYISGVLLLLYVAFFGVEAKGAQSWIQIGNFFRIQPAEFMKIFLVISIAHLVTKWQEKQEEKSLKNDIILTIKIALISILPFGLIVTQPDLGTAMVIIGMIAVMLIVSGISWRILVLLLILGISVIMGLVFLYFTNIEIFNMIIKQHQLPRIISWLDPEADPKNTGYQLIQSLLAIGSGQLVGKGFTEGSQIQGGWIPEVHTDFIFAVIGEEFGFIGASVLVSVFFILVYRLVQIALSCNDLFGSYVVAGIIGLIVFQVFQNIGMTIGVVPITGIALPFISYGGSALVTNMLAMGIVLNIAMRTKNYMFD